MAGASGHPTVVMLHGFMGTGEDWGEVACHLPPAFRCLTPDLPGHDGKPLDLGACADPFVAYAELLWQDLEPLLPPRFGLVGYSLGGRLALDLTCRYPERISALVLEAAHPGLVQDGEREERAASDADWARRFEREPLPWVLQDWYRQPVFASLSKEQRRDFILRRSTQVPGILADVLRATSLAQQPNRWDDLPRLAMPFGFIVGRRDTKFCAVGDRMAGLAPNLTLVKLDGLGHNCHALAPEAVAGFIHRLCTAEHASP
ncbi:MAG: 2-succinyl-6-hydroxy-2,4-cyclohexadiene-1-carboxylate synthase [Thioalkalivibrio sp.]|nr:2-succinyl-6-hydroxy-2,4-cyclohexadiene-1-carboxylate synthase [Thioalkalivibrio sp.]